jgi:hypothetical protein
MTANPNKWYAHAYRRAVIDMHIPDWDDKFLSEVDVNQYVAMLIKARAQSVVAYAMSHVGLFNYPTKVGQQHRSLKGRNLLKEIVDHCHAHQIAVVVYNSLIFDRWAADAHPDWRLRAHDGSVHGKGGRHGLLCPNSPYREYVRAWIEEECTHFKFDGIRFDMTFWPAVCYCKYCRQRFAKEVGGDIPTTVNWLDERWVTFQRKREEWLAEFAALATDTVRKHKPNVSVEHQSSTYPLNWVFGVNAPLVAQNDFLQGDFYGDSWHGSFVRKLLEDLTPNRPFGFETSFSVDLSDHTAMKPAALLEAKASAAITDSAAFVFIDGIDPIGTLNSKVYERMGGIFDRLMPYYPQLGGSRVADIAVYYSLDSKFNFAGNGRHIGSPDTSDAHTAAVMSATRWLMTHHLPFAVITKKSLASVANHKLLILSNVNVMDREEVAAIREWVRAGGYLFATGWTSLVDKQGRVQNDFMLADVFGVTLRKANWQPWPHYISPTAAGQLYFGDFSAKYPAYAKGLGMEVFVRPAAHVLAVTTLPWTAPDPSKFSSIHSNPPWQSTDRPEVVLNSFGEGRVVYCSSPIESVDGLSETFIQLLRLLHSPYTFEVDAPACVEVTLFHQPEQHRYRLSLVNFQRDLPNVPVEGIQVHLHLSQRVHRVTQFPVNRRIDHRENGKLVAFTVPRLETLAMFAVDVG